MSGDGYNFKKLRDAILEKSQSKEWDIAKKEWIVREINFAEEPETCACGHQPIIEICTIYNTITRMEIDVGNECVKKFIGIKSHLIFDCIKRIQKDRKRSPNEDTAIFFRKRGTISAYDYDFIIDNIRKRKLTPKQENFRILVNNKILSSIKIPPI